MKKLMVVTLVWLGAFGVASGEQPNIVLLFSDDAGYADFGFNNSRHFKTPRLDALMKSGVELKQFYVSAAVCGPSRAGLLTGKYQQRFGYEENNVPGYMSHSGTTGDEMGLPVDQQTMGDHLKTLGYRTAIFGKWHQGNADRFHPLQRGFDEFVGFRGGARSFYAYKEGDAVRPEDRLEWGFGDYREPEDYLTDVLADEACRFIERNKENPFFAFVSFNAVHTPIEPDPQDKDLFPELEGRRRALAQLTFSMDRAIGRIVDQIERLGLRDNTLIIFTNDNGGPTDASTSSNWPLSGCKATHLEGGIRVPGIVVWPGRVKAGSAYAKPLSTLDLLPTFLRAAGGTIPEGLDGVDMMPFLTGRDKGRPHQSLYWKKENRGTIRDGDWKMMRFPDRPAELYDIEKDPAEQNNLATEHPELVRALYKKLFAWECGLERPMFMLQRLYEEKAAERFDQYRTQYP